MNSLVKQQFFQLTLNQFLVLDKDLIPWKLSCVANFEFVHKIHIENFRPVSGTGILDVIDIVKLDLFKHVTYEPEEEPRSDCAQFYINSNFDTGLFDHNFGYLTNLTYLKLHFIWEELEDHHIHHLTSLVYLDIGDYNYFTDDAFENLQSLEVLFLRNNRAISSKVFSFLPNLHTIQISNRSKISIDEIPETVTSVTVDVYDKLCEHCDFYECIMETKQVRPDQ